MPSPVLADSNILLRVAQPSHAHHAVALAALDKLLAQNFDLCIVMQNLVEFWAVATRPVASRGLGMSSAIALNEMRKLRSIFYLLDGAVGIADVWTKLVADQLVSGKQAHDAHLAAMGVYGVQQLLTFNGDDFKRYPGITVLNPVQL
jgi:predicted nucleic acid-binding protein